MLLTTLAKSQKDIDRNPPADGDYTAYSQLSRLISASVATLAEVADDRAAQAIRGLLEKETDPMLGAQLMRCLETIYGLPSFFHGHGICGVGLTPEALREHQKREAVAFEKQKQVVARLACRRCGKSARPPSVQRPISFFCTGRC